MITKKKLIIFIPSIEDGGVEKNLFIISNYLSSRINQIKLITADNKKKYFKNIQLVYPKTKFWYNSNRYFKYFICLILLIKQLSKNKNTVVLAFQANLYSIMLCKLLGVKIIIRSNTSPSGWSKNIIKMFFYKHILKLADEIVVNSEEFKKQLKLLFSLKSICIYNPLNKNEIIKKSKEKLNFKFLENKSKFVKIINISRFTDQKDHLTLLKAIRLIKNNIKFRLLLIGQGENKILIQNFINKNSLSKNVRVIDYKKNPYKYLRSSDIFILTSLFEGLPNVLLEAAVLKKLIISTNCKTGPKEILSNGKGGVLVKPRDFKSISKTIVSFSQNKKKFNKKINFVFKSLNRFDYIINLNKYLKLVNKYLNN